MGVSEEIAEIKKNIGGEFVRRLNALYMLCDYYQAKAVQMFREYQAENMFWTNRTSTAYSTVYGGVTKKKEFVAWGLAHKVEYGVWLEMANDRKHESLRPILSVLEPEFMKDARDIFGD